MFLPLQSLPYPILTCLNISHWSLPLYFRPSTRIHLPDLPVSNRGLGCPHFTKSERQSQGKPFCLLPGTHKLALPLPHSRSLPGAPDHPFLLYNLRCRHFYRDRIHRGDLTDLQEQGPGETVGLSREGAGEEIRVAVLFTGS